MSVRALNFLPLASILAITPALHAQCRTDKVFAGAGATDDRFGYAVAVCDDIALCGAYLRDQGATGQAGGAYVFERGAAGWMQIQELVASDASGDAWFGSDVAVDGSTAIVGARGADFPFPDSGSVYVFERQGSGWIEIQELGALDAGPYQYFGSAVDVHGTYAVVGAPHQNGPGVAVGAVYVFERGASGWAQTKKLKPSDLRPYGFYGGEVAISGDTLLVGATEGALNHAYVVERSGTDWAETQVLSASDMDLGDGFGSAVDVLGDRAVVGAIFDDELGLDAGAAYVFERVEAGWAEVVKLTASDGTAYGNFGVSVALGEDRIVVGTESRAYVFVLRGGVWQESTILLPEGGGLLSYFGSDLALSDDQVIVGQYRGAGATSVSGAAYLYRFADGIERYCTATPNSTGGVAHLSVTGCGSYSANDLELAAFPVPWHTVGLFFYGPAQTELPFGNGYLCVSGPITRLPAAPAVGYGLRYTLDDTWSPTPWGQITVGSTWYFQAWYHDPTGGGAGVNLSDAMGITFAP